MRTDRFLPLSRPRSIQRSNKGHFIKEYDYQHDGAYSISELLYPRNEPYAFADEKDVLSWMLIIMADSPLALALIKEARETGWKIALSDINSDGFHLDVENRIIDIDNFGMDACSIGKSVYYQNLLITILSKGLRDIWHENRWGAFEENYAPEAVLMLERARAADTDSVFIMIAWELRGANHGEVWRDVLASDDGDMARVLINIMERYPTALYNGMAMAHIFRQWYVDEGRVDALDHESLQQMDSIILENNVNFGKHSALSAEFELLSLLPDGVCYLNGLGDTVAKDPFFNDLNDTVNHTHLFQIVYDNSVTYVGNIPFQDAKLARKFINV